MIRSFDYLRSFAEIEDQIQDALLRTLRSGQLILGPETEAFEQEFAAYVGAAHCVGVTSGTTALHLALAALGVGPGHEVVTVANTCAPTVAAIRQTGASPVFVDVREDDLLMNVEQLESLLTPRVRCILPVHLWGHGVNLDRLVEVAAKYHVPIVEDCAQAHGTTWNGRHVGTFGVAGCFSFYPTKNIGAYGDAGAVVTNDSDLAQRIRRLRVYGYGDSPVSQEEGINGRISELQAAILRVKLQVFPDWLERRLSVAEAYDALIRNPLIRLPPNSACCRPTYHQYVVRLHAREALAAFLEERGIQSAVHYPMPIHLMPAYSGLTRASATLPVTEAACQEILSLPIHESVSPGDAARVAGVLNEFGG